IDKLSLEGILNGNVHFKQTKNIFEPTSSLEILDLAINDIELGNLVADIEGDESLRKFGVNIYLYDGDEDVFSAEGDLEIINKNTFANLDIRMSNFNLSPFSNFGGEVITNLRGLATGRTTVIGYLTNPEINGRIFLDKSGFKIPYLNVDFDLENNTIVDITEKQI